MFHHAWALASRATRMTGVLLVLSAVVGLASAAAAPPGTSVIRFGSSSWSVSKYSTAIILFNEHQDISGIKSASPGTRVLGYKSGLEMMDNCGSLVEICHSGISYQQALAHDSAYTTSPRLACSSE